MSTPSRQRRKAVEQYVESWVSYAFFSKDHTNPFEKDDKRHKMFARQLGRTLAIDADFREMHEIHGGDASQLKLRKYSKPKMIPLESIGPPRIEPPPGKTVLS